MSRLRDIMLQGVWSEGDVCLRDDGFLIVNDDPEENDQPLLLHSTTLLLRMLYPDMSMTEIFNQKGYLKEALLADSEFIPVDNDEKNTSVRSNTDDVQIPPDNAAHSKISKRASDTNEESKKDIPSKISPQYEIFQRLLRHGNPGTLADRIHSALLDIQHFRHREKKRDKNRVRLSRDEVKIRALEHQQNRLLSQQPESPEDLTHESQEDQDQEEDRTESSTIRLVRSINSIRALYPHLIPILGHPKRRRKDLVIGTVQLKNKKNQMSWLLGTKVFDITTEKSFMSAYWNARSILEAFIDVNKSTYIFSNPHGEPEFWTEEWIECILSKVNNAVVSPLTLLANDDNLDAITSRARQFDKTPLIRKQDDSPTEHKEYLKAIRIVHNRVTMLLMNRFPKARVSIYGSCLSDLSLGKASDVDLSLWLPEAAQLKAEFQKGKIDASRYEKEMKRFVYQACRKLENLPREFVNMQPITRARVPVVKGTYLKAGNPYSDDGTINFDVCFLNDIAVANSGLIREYSLVDQRVKDLMLTVKRWAKEYNVNSAKDNSISSYAWINLVIFYLQCLGLVPNLQCPKLMEAVGITPDPEGNDWHCVNNLDTCTLSWDQVRDANAWEQQPELKHIPVSALLYGFYEFYGSRFPYGIFAASIKRGDMSVSKLAFRKRSLFFCIEDPFETFDSHCPHDLGTPAGETGAKDILKYLRDAEVHLRCVLQGEKSSDRLWPAPPFSEPLPPRQQKNAPQYLKFGRSVKDLLKADDQNQRGDQYNDEDRNAGKPGKPHGKFRMKGQGVPQGKRKPDINQDGTSERNSDQHSKRKQNRRKNRRYDDQKDKDKQNANEKKQHAGQPYKNIQNSDEQNKNQQQSNDQDRHNGEQQNNDMQKCRQQIENKQSAGHPNKDMHKNGQQNKNKQQGNQQNKQSGSQGKASKQNGGKQVDHKLDLQETSKKDYKQQEKKKQQRNQNQKNKDIKRTNTRRNNHGNSEKQTKAQIDAAQGNEKKENRNQENMKS